MVRGGERAGSVGDVEVIGGRRETWLEVLVTGGRGKGKRQRAKGKSACLGAPNSGSLQMTVQ
jgi:hypothetical protein